MTRGARVALLVVVALLVGGALAALLVWAFGWVTALIVAPVAALIVFLVVQATGIISREEPK